MAYKRRIWYLGNGFRRYRYGQKNSKEGRIIWGRVGSKGEFKRVSKARGEREKHRILGLRKVKQGAKVKPAKPSEKISAVIEKSFDLCVENDRVRFLLAVEADFERLKRDLPTYEFKAVEVVIDIGFDVSKRSKRKDGLTRGRGLRRFVDPRSLQKFLVLDAGREYRWGRRNVTGINWGRDGLCQYRKQARIELPEYKRGRLVNRKVFVTYKLKEPQ